MTTGFTAKNTEFMLQANNLKPAVVQERRRANVILGAIVVDLKTDRGRIVIGLTVIGHRDNGGFQIGPGRCHRLLKMGGKGRYATSARQ